MFRMYRVFCGTPWELEEERLLFHDVIGKVNEARGLANKILFIPVSLPSLSDKRRFTYQLKQNIRDCSYFILVLMEEWGPKERSFETEYRLALEFQGDPALPMKDVAVLAKYAVPPPDLPEPTATFTTTASFTGELEALLNRWMDLLEGET